MNELKRLAGRINAREESIQRFRALAVGAVNQTITAVIEQGEDLAKAKEIVPHGDWLAWLARHCKKLSERTAQRYMAVAAKAPRVADLTEAESLRHALALCSLEGQGEGKTPAPAAGPKQFPPYLDALGKIRKLAGFVKTNPMQNWPEEGVECCREELLPLARELWPDNFKR